MVRPNRRASSSGAPPSVIHASRRRANASAAAMTDGAAAGMRSQCARTASIETVVGPSPARGVPAESSGHHRAPACALSCTPRPRGEPASPGPRPTRNAPRDPAISAAIRTSSVSPAVVATKASVCSSTYPGTSVPRTTVKGTARCRALSATAASAAVAAVPWANATTARVGIGAANAAARAHSSAAREAPLNCSGRAAASSHAPSVSR